MKHLKIEKEPDYRAKQLKDKSASIEMKMIIDDGETVSPFVKMFCLDDFRDMTIQEIEKIIMDNSSHIARTFIGALHSRPDCLDGNNQSG